MSAVEPLVHVLSILQYIAACRYEYLVEVFVYVFEEEEEYTNGQKQSTEERCQ